MVIHLKRRIERFYTDTDEREVFALYEDVDENIHFKYTDYDTDMHQMHSCHFEKQFKRI
ncbi:hypothetical protein ACFSGI_08910 [Paenibacillus nicotianae]|uniref:Uncharacterized protein n=1 Tax=Paenibacillus nicotianae TaxID=1526551 RepID=A0ABW4UR89_9BACL